MALEDEDIFELDGVSSIELNELDSAVVLNEEELLLLCVVNSYSERSKEFDV